jgi:DNA-binding response OmpR family regulator
MATILVVEDEPAMVRGLKDNLEFEHYNVETVSDGETGLQRILDGNYDLIILDVMLPKLSGFDVCKKAREKGIVTPIIMLTAKGEEIDKVLGLELGADDYLTKPFGLRELLARIKALLRRSEGTVGKTGEKIILCGLEIDFTAYTAERDGKPIPMTPKEIDIIKYLWQHRNKTVTRDDLLTSVWGYDESISTRTVDNFMLKLRQKIEKNPSKPKQLITVHGVGYKLISQ